jgi:transcriptional regulator with XRE-family HTH domain
LKIKYLGDGILDFLDALKETRERYDITQTEIARAVGVSKSAWSRYEKREIKMPRDVSENAIKYLGDARLKAIYAYEQKTEYLNAPFLDNVDENPSTVLWALIEEAEELVDSSKKLEKLIRNKSSKEDFSKSEWEDLVEYEMQIADLIPALKLHFVRMNEKFDLDLDLLELKLKNKLRSKKYIK